MHENVDYMNMYNDFSDNSANHLLIIIIAVIVIIFIIARQHQWTYFLRTILQLFWSHSSTQ